MPLYGCRRVMDPNWFNSMTCYIISLKKGTTSQLCDLKKRSETARWLLAFFGFVPPSVLHSFIRFFSSLFRVFFGHFFLIRWPALDDTTAGHLSSSSWSLVAFVYDMFTRRVIRLFFFASKKPFVWQFSLVFISIWLSSSLNRWKRNAIARRWGVVSIYEGAPFSWAAIGRLTGRRWLVAIPPMAERRSQSRDESTTRPVPNGRSNGLSIDLSPMGPRKTQ